MSTETEVKETNSSEQDVNAQETVTEQKSEQKEPEKVPYERLQEVVKEKETYKGMVDMLSEQIAQTQRQVQQLTAQKETLPEFSNPEDAAAYEARLNRDKTQLQGQMGFILDQLDEAKAMQRIPGYADEKTNVSSEIAKLQKQYQANGGYIKREDAYAFLVGKGVIKPKSESKSEEVIVKKTKPAAVAETESHSKGNNTSVKDFKSLTIEEKEKALEGKVF
jgi:hypothetical protein